MVPRDDRSDDDDGERLPLLLRGNALAPDDGPALLERLPDSLKETGAHGVERVRPNARKDVPEPIFVAGIVSDGEGDRPR